MVAEAGSTASNAMSTLSAANSSPSPAVDMTASAAGPFAIAQSATDGVQAFHIGTPDTETEGGLGLASPSRKQGRRDDGEAPPAHRSRGGLPDITMEGTYVTVTEFKAFADKLQVVLNTMTHDGN